MTEEPSLRPRRRRSPFPKVNLPAADPIPTSLHKNMMSKQFVLCLLLAQAINTAFGQYPTHPPGASRSDSSSQLAKDYEYSNYLDCSAGAVSSSTTSTTSISPSSSSSSPSNSTTSSSPSSSPSSVPCPCLLHLALQNMSSTLLNSTEQIVFQAILVEIQVVLMDGSLTLDVKVMQIGDIIQQCFDSNDNIRAKLSNEKIADRERLYEFLLTGRVLDSKNVPALMAPLDNDGNCVFTNGLLQAVAGNPCGTNASALVQVFVKNLKNLTRKGNTQSYDTLKMMSGAKKLAKKNFFVSLTIQEQSCILNLTIPGYNGTFGRFMNLAGQYDTLSSIASLIINGTVYQNVLIQSLNQTLNSNSTVNSTNPTNLQEANSFLQNITIYFSGTSDTVSRMAFFAVQIGKLSSVTRSLLRTFKLKAGFFICTVQDLLAASHFYKNENPGNLTYGLGSLTYLETMYIDATTKSCDFLDAIFSYFNANGYSGFNSDKNAIRNCVYRNNTPTANGNCTIPYLNHFNTTNLNSTQRAVFLSWPIRTVYIETDIYLIFGTIAGFMCYFGGLCG